MAKTDDWMPLRLQIWRSGTAFMMPEARGPYLDLILAYWELGPLPNDDSVLQGVARVTDAKLWKRIRHQVISKFVDRDGTLHHERCDTERALAKQAYERKSSAGKAGGQASAQARSKQPSTSASSNRSTDVQSNVNTTYQEHSPNGEPEANASGSAAAPKPPKRATSLPPDWTPNERNISDAKTRGYRPERITELAEHFRDHHRAKGTTSKDWDASWRTWLANDKRFSAGRDGAGKPRQHRPGAGSVVDVVARLKARADLGGSGERGGVGRCGDGVSAASIEPGFAGEGAGDSGEIINADDAERMFRASRGAEVAGAAGEHERGNHGSPAWPLRAETGGVPGGRGQAGSGDTAEHQQMVAGMVGIEGEAGPVLSAPAQAAGGAEDTDMPDLPDFLRRIPATAV